ncbi:hypothetical protein ACUY3U_22700 [Gordonia amicalis]|uniref:hypothetical protein n=1 Tax=Gordonia amicalis TaxID=89053 RepID=UPI00042A214B|nr:hypothetical protein [Gordonia amicalis]MCZ0913348.1 hypothetical protein [Gordonia amicalis]
MQGAAIAALIVSITSACITLGGLIWQLTLYRLSGARLRVQLLFHYRDDNHAVRQVTGSKRRPWKDPRIDQHSPEVFGIEAVRVRVTNVGRSPVSVDDISLDVGRTPWRRLGRRGRRSITPPAFVDEDSKDTELREPSSGPERLEAGDTTSRVYRLWPSLAEELERRGERVTVRGTARMAGKHRPRLSPRRFAWTFAPGEETWFLDHEVTPELRVYRVLWRHSQFDYVGGVPVMMHREVAKQLRDGSSASDIKALLESVKSDGIFGSVAFDAHEAFHKGKTETDRSGVDASAEGINSDDGGKQE